MLIRISLILAILAGLAVGVLNFIYVKEKITTLQANLASEKAARASAESERDKTKKELAKTTAELKTTQQTLEATSAERDKAVETAAAQTKRADKIAEDLNKARTERDAAQAELAAYVATGLRPEQIIAINKQFKNLQETLAGSEAENKVLGQKITRLQNELDIYTHPEKPVYLPASLAGKILVFDPKWDFVVLNVGENQGVLENGQLLVNRNGKLVAKVIVRSVQKDRCIANIIPGWKLGDVVEGDQVIPAYPAS